MYSTTAAPVPRFFCHLSIGFCSQQYRSVVVNCSKLPKQGSLDSQLSMLSRLCTAWVQSDNSLAAAAEGWMLKALPANKEKFKCKKFLCLNNSRMTCWVEGLEDPRCSDSFEVSGDTLWQR